MLSSAATPIQRQALHTPATTQNDEELMMATVNIVGAGHPRDPFQVQILMGENDLDDARSAPGLILDPPQMGYDADPQIRSIIIHWADASAQ
ncbi:MAG: hypothetical protein ACR2KJ_06945 [Jatrophihabitans sp.]